MCAFFIYIMDDNPHPNSFYSALWSPDGDFTPASANMCMIPSLGGVTNINASSASLPLSY